MLRSTQYALDARVYDEDAIPPASLAAKRGVLEAKRPDVIGVGKPSWNGSTVSENMARFPDRAMMRQLAVYDSIKRADYNYRAETLDWRDKRVYEPVPNKFQVNRRNLGRAPPMLDAPPALSRTEFPAHPSLATKPRWDPATGHAGDPYRAEKEKNARIEAESIADRDYSRRHPPKLQQPTLKQREEIFLAEQRKAKELARAERERAAAMGMPLGTSTWAGYNTLGSSVYPAPAVTAADRVAMDVTQQVPARKTTTWSLGGF